MLKVFSWLYDPFPQNQNGSPPPQNYIQDVSPSCDTCKKKTGPNGSDIRPTANNDHTVIYNGNCTCFKSKLSRYKTFVE